MHVMRKAKIVLTTIAIFAVVGGALAFKAKRNVTTFCRLGSPGVCTLTYEDATYNNAVNLATYCTIIEANGCFQTAVTAPKD
jgi:hypothetical protein